MSETGSLKSTNEHRAGYEFVSTEVEWRIDAVAALYFLLTAAIIWFHRVDLPSWELFLTAHLVAAAAIRMLRRLDLNRLPAAARFVRDWYPIFLFPVLYKEVEWLAMAFGDWSLTQTLQHLEVAAFNGHPSLYLSQSYPWRPLSEYLHFCYFGYLLLLPLVGGVWYFNNRRDHFQELLLLVTATLFASYVFFMLYPVDSPFYLFDRLETPLADGFFYQLVHFFSQRGGARGGAFPSAHVSVSVVVWLVTWRRQRRLAWVLAPVIGGLVFATVYGRFHYVVDVLAGLLLAALVTFGYRLWSTSEPGSVGVYRTST
jgi:membrane-associated phospholipid phosphatase